MVVSFVRIDDRMIHGLITTRWGKERPCDGIIAVNDKAASNKVLKEAYKAAAEGKKTFVWTLEHFKEVQDKVLNSDTRYFLITKNPQDMKEILVDWGFKPSDVKTVNVGPANDRDGSIKLGDNQSFTQEEAECFQAIEAAGYTVDLALLPDQRLGEWSKFKGKFEF
ncbi:PTS system mannose/fructose/N-acetylgalactosamine-transporter subunit IIB [Streptococcus loxodontisalivarius]|uniref:PTS system mannose-specific IIB component n=1 Tax=Streptococcus loxodontisalivarius TaxID=1349415 RepID=A0ABS2PU40_9STRE|nr:PTS sugar transporter subunit IIB [Streptococcus loxodontisalivarius]MBM7643578.1 PTS system mannose-specific IIB component [Streptococcus loxodontisalivarius]